jgi:hypothetical protein
MAFKLLNDLNTLGFVLSAHSTILGLLEGWTQVSDLDYFLGCFRQHRPGLQVLSQLFPLFRVVNVLIYPGSCSFCTFYRHSQIDIDDIEDFNSQWIHCLRDSIFACFQRGYHRLAPPGISTTQILWPQHLLQYASLCSSAQFCLRHVD